MSAAGSGPRRAEAATLIRSLLGHQLAELQTLPISPLAVTAGAVSVVVLVACSPRRTGPPTAPECLDEPQPTRASRPLLAVALLLAGVAVVAGLTGPPSAARNLLPGLFVSVGWPLLLVAGALAGPAWRRPVPSSPAEQPLQRAGVHAAAVTALLVVWYLVVQPDRAAPRTVAAFLLVYGGVTAAGCLIAGWRSWLARGEALGLLLAWTGRLRRGGLVGWTPPAGAAVVLGVFAGGFLFGLWRSADPWLWLVQRHPVAGVATFLGAVGGAVGLLTIAERRAARRGAPGSVAAASVPLVVGLALAHAVDRGLLTAVQLLPHALADPLGRGWRLVDPGGVGVLPADVDPLAVIGIQLVLVLTGGMAAALVARARAGRGPAGWSVAALLAAAILAVANQSVRTPG